MPWCRYIAHALYLAPDELRHCCKRFFVDGQRRGDVRIFSVTGDADLDTKRIIAAKHDLATSIQRGESTPCSGCPWLQNGDPTPQEQLSINMLSIECQTKCSMRCSYCSEVYYGGKRSAYNLSTCLDRLIDAKILAPDLDVAWGGGEPVLLPDFERILRTYTALLHPVSNRIFSNALTWSPAIAEILTKNQAVLITSIDAGTDATFRKVRGLKTGGQLDRVLGHLARYQVQAGRGITLKYVFTGDNYASEEIDAFLDLVQKYNLVSCDYQISANFEVETITDDQAIGILRLRAGLERLGVHDCHLDDLLQPKLSTLTTTLLTSGDLVRKARFPHLRNMEAFRDQPIAMWGAGDIGLRLVKESPFLRLARMVQIVDGNPNKVGISFAGLSVENPERLRENNLPIIIASSRDHSVIRGRIVAMGISENRIVDSMWL